MDEDDRVRPVGSVRATNPARKAADRYDSERSRTWLPAPIQATSFPKVLERLRKKHAATTEETPAEPVTAEKDHPLASSGPLGRLLDTEA
ncbi:hypothetical protein [Chitinimonas naiadis]